MINNNELQALKSVAQEIVSCTGNQFGFLSDAAAPEGMTRKQFDGYCGQLTQKKLIWIDDEFGSAMLTGAGDQVLKQNGLFADKRFETI